MTVSGGSRGVWRRASRWPALLLLLCGIAVDVPAGEARPNVLLICVDDLRPELGCYGVEYIRTPHIDAIAAAGRVFERHYVQAPTCGASRYALLTGRYGPAHNGALIHRAKKIDDPALSPSLPAWMRQHGYRTVSVGKVSHHPGGLGGRNWDDASLPEMPRAWDRSRMPSGSWKHPKGAMHGLANGQIRVAAGKMDVFEHADVSDAAYPDGLIARPDHHG